MALYSEPGGVPAAPAATSFSARSRLHGFDLPSWGSYKIMSCGRGEDKGDRRAGTLSSCNSGCGGVLRVYSRSRRRGRVSAAFKVLAKGEAGVGRTEKEGEGEDVSAFRKDLADHGLRETVACAKPEAAAALASSERTNSTDCTAVAAAAPKQWNLREKRTDCTAAAKENGPRRAQNQILLSPPKKKAAAENELPNFSIALAKKDISEDLAKIFGAGRPSKKRKAPHKVQKVLDEMFPGLSLSHINRHSYRSP